MADLHITLHKLFAKGKYPIIFTGAFWIAGLVSGGVVAYHAEPSVIAIVRTSVTYVASLPGLLLMLFLPAVLSVIVAKNFSAYWVMPLVFVKAMCFGFACCICCDAFGSAGWLIRCLLLFSDTVSAFALVCLWLRLFFNPAFSTKQTIKHITILSIGLFCFEHFVVSPFVVSLF